MVHKADRSVYNGRLSDKRWFPIGDRSPAVYAGISNKRYYKRETGSRPDMDYDGIRIFATRSTGRRTRI